MKKIFAQFIPIITIFLLMAHTNKLAEFSHSILGKLIAVGIIIFYTCLDKILGLFVCSLVIYYYQSDCVENMLNMETEGFESTVDMNVEPAVEQPIDTNIKPEDNDMNNYVMPNTNNGKKTKQLVNENMTNYVELYENNNDDDTGVNTEIMGQFRKQYCSGTVLKYKDMPVNLEMTEHVFPEIKFKGSVCNPCSEKCKYSIIESKLKTEFEMMPKSSSNQ